MNYTEYDPDLPSDVLTCVFEELSCLEALYPKYTPGHDRMSAKLCLVNKRWNAAATTTRALWKNVAISGNWFDDTRMWALVRLYTTRGGVNLRLFVHEMLLDSKTKPRLSYVFCSLAPKLFSVYIDYVCQSHWEGLRLPALHLDSIEIVSRATAFDRYVHGVIQPFPKEFAAARTVTIQGGDFSFSGLPQEIEWVHARIDVDTDHEHIVSTCLSRSPRLETLYVKFHREGSICRGPMLRNENIRELILAGQSSRLTQRLDLPNLQIFYFNQPEEYAIHHQLVYPDQIRVVGLFVHSEFTMDTYRHLIQFGGMQRLVFIFTEDRIRSTLYFLASVANGFPKLQVVEVQEGEYDDRVRLPSADEDYEYTVDDYEPREVGSFIEAFVDRWRVELSHRE